MNWTPRIWAAAGVIGGCILASALFGAPAIETVEGATYVAPRTHQQPAPTKPTAQPGAQGGGNDSCRWANDNECDDPDIGTGACPMNTDISDCRAVRAGEDDSCRWARDGECDEPTYGTGSCRQATDRSDCGDLTRIRNRTDSCATALNGVCEEPGHGAGACAPRTDRADCFGRERPLTINDHFFGRDDRVLVPVNQRPWSYMGALVTEVGDSCTATLIARNVIVTAAHCIHTEAGLNAAGVFTPAAGGATARVVGYLVDQRFDYRRFGAGSGLDGVDWALLRLDQPLGDQLGFAGVQNLLAVGAQPATAAELMQAGYSWDTGGHLSGNLRCRVAQVFPGHSFSHECDTTRGDSGSAFLVRNGRGYDVVGIDSKFGPDGVGPQLYIAVSAAAFAPRLADFVAGRTGFRVGTPPSTTRRKPG